MRVNDEWEKTGLMMIIRMWDKWQRSIQLSASNCDFESGCWFIAMPFKYFLIGFITYLKKNEGTWKKFNSS